MWRTSSKNLRLLIRLASAKMSSSNKVISEADNLTPALRSGQYLRILTAIRLFAVVTKAQQNELPTLR
ncbi:hypothetical protein P5673_031837 [Acropora cervicornis]|uniref:Uncharacterized protein n=1 Tax=Acropora cervicornis TaxID=6130 RepID=A0AAD9PS81_ACRCE|nr:hypothetical protein P5673_031837 [Acropora cervicornis]